MVLKEALTGLNGEFSAEGYSSSRLSADVRKNGYYLSGSPFVIFTNVAGGHWQPWNPTVEIIMRPIGKPITLYAKNVQATIPVLDKPCGYDLEVGDWVAPFGKGLKSDLIFSMHQDYRGMQDYDLIGELTFEHPLDGLVDAPVLEAGKNSVFKWERQAPEAGFRQKFQLLNTWHKGQGVTRSFKLKKEAWEGYFFRVRTVEQDGKIVSACYGKIWGGIEVFPSNLNPKVIFTCYFNTTPNDRNLEWDTKKNLFGNLSFMENPSEP